MSEQTQTITIPAGQKITQEGQKYELTQSVDVEALTLDSTPPQTNKHKALVCPDQGCCQWQVTHGKKKLIVVRGTEAVISALWLPKCGGCGRDMVFVDPDELKALKALGKTASDDDVMTPIPSEE